MLVDFGDVCGYLLEENKYVGKMVWWLYKLRGMDLKIVLLECNNVVFCLFEVYFIVVEVGCKLGGDVVVQGFGYLNEIVKWGNFDNEVIMVDYILDCVLDE